MFLLNIFNLFSSLLNLWNRVITTVLISLPANSNICISSGSVWLFTFLIMGHIPHLSVCMPNSFSLMPFIMNLPCWVLDIFVVSIFEYVLEHSSVQFSRSVVSDSLQPHELQHTRPPCPSPTPRVYPNSCPSSRWCHPAILSSVIPFSSCPQSLPASGSFQMSQLFASSGQNIGVSASTSVLLMNTQDWSLLGWTGWISSQSKGLSRVFSNPTVQKHQFFGAHHSSQSNFYIHTWLLEKP